MKEPTDLEIFLRLKQAELGTLQESCPHEKLSEWTNMTSLLHGIEYQFRHCFNCGLVVEKRDYPKHKAYKEEDVYNKAGES